MGKGSGGPRIGCGAKFIKVILVLFNLLFFLLGIGILVVGVYVLVDPTFKQLKHITNNQSLVDIANQNGVNITYIDKCGIAFCVFGGVMLMISFMGCCGALKQAKCLLGFYSTILLGLLLAEIGIGIFAAVYSAKFRDLVTPLLRQSINDQYMGDMSNKSVVSVAWDAVMYNFECCGVQNYTDFNMPGNVWTYREGQVIPRACCKYKNRVTDWSGVLPNITDQNGYPNCTTDPSNVNSNYDIGCYNKIQSMINQYSVIVIAVAIGVGVILFLGVLFGFYLCKEIDELEDYA